MVQLWVLMTRVMDELDAGLSTIESELNAGLSHALRMQDEALLAFRTKRVMDRLRTSAKPTTEPATKPKPKLKHAATPAAPSPRASNLAHNQLKRQRKRDAQAAAKAPHLFMLHPCARPITA